MSSVGSSGTAGVHDPHRVLQAGEGPLPAPEEDRPITIREAARCMSFPDDFVFPDDQKWTEIAKADRKRGAALLAQAIAGAVATQLDSPRAKFHSQAA